MNQILTKTLVELVEVLRTREVSATELMEAVLAAPGWARGVPGSSSATICR